jgi:flagellar M-ring protein FliF
MAYAPRTKEDLERIATLVRSAIGFNEKRGDMVEVVNLRFAEPAVIPQAAADTGFLSMLRFTTDDIMRSVEIGVMLILGLLVLLFVVRPLVRRVITPDESATPVVVHAAPALAPPSPEAPSEPKADPEHPAAKLIESAQIMGEAHQKSMQKVGELVQQNPQETVAVIRQWMTEKVA